MDVMQWTGALACHLQTALRASNEGFAARLGVSTRTIATWHDRPDITPRPEMQAALDTLLEKAEPGARRRFDQLATPQPAAGPQALRVAIAVVRRDKDVLLVCRRGDDSLAWQFPAGVVKPGSSSRTVAVNETLAETGIRAAVSESLGSRQHPVTGVLADYYLCDHLGGEVTNRDIVENSDVAWVPIVDLTRYIPAERIHAPVLTALETT